VIKDNFDKLLLYVETELEIQVEFEKGQGNGYYFDENSSEQEENFIIIDSAQNKEIQMFSLLHEVGHHIVRKDNKYNINFPYGFKLKNKSISRRVDVMREEVIAWENGRLLAQKLEINLNEKKWHNFMKKNLFDYIKWACDPENI